MVPASGQPDEPAKPTRGLPPLGPRGEGWFAGQIVVIGLVAGCGLAGPPWPAAVSAPFVVVGTLLAVGGLGVALAGVRTLGASLTPFPKPTDGATLRDRGVYGRVRHPIYAGSLVAGLGWSLATSPLALVPTLLAAGFLELKSRREEHWLNERYPDYRSYVRRVRWKFVPGIR